MNQWFKGNYYSFVFDNKNPFADEEGICFSKELKRNPTRIKRFMIDENYNIEEFENLFNKFIKTFEDFRKRMFYIAEKQADSIGRVYDFPCRQLQIPCTH